MTNQSLVLSTINVSYIHRNLALRWLYVAAPADLDVTVKEYTLAKNIGEIAEDLVLKQPDIIAFGVYIFNVEKIKALIAILKNRYVDLRIILGGPEISFEDDWWFDLGVEALIVGEGEIALYKYLKSNRADGVRTLGYRSEVAYAVTPLSYLETLELPYFLEFDKNKFKSQYFYLETSRGCPYNCSYCFSAVRRPRFFSLSYLKSVIMKLDEYEIRQVKILDRTFNADIRHAKAVLDLFEQLKHQLNIQMEVVIDQGDEEFIEILKRLKDPTTYRLEIGIQSFTTTVLKAIGRHSDEKVLVDRINRLREHGFIIHGDLIAGLPDETFASFKTSFDRLYDLKPTEIQVGTLKLLKGTRIREKAEEYGMIYDPIAPYQVKSTSWLKESEMTEIETVAQSVEKLYNRGRLCNTLTYLIDDKGREAWAVFAGLGEIIKGLDKPYPLVELFRVIAELEPNDKELKGRLNQDYYRNFNHKVNRLFADRPDKTENARIREYLLKKKIVNAYQYDNYAIVAPAFLNKDYYLIFVIVPAGKKPRQYKVAKEEL